MSARALLLSLHPFCLRVPVGFSLHPQGKGALRAHDPHCYVLSVGNLYNPDVRYTFNIPIEDKPQQFYWNEHGPWQPCSKLCQGERKRKPVCKRESDQLTVSDQRCDRVPQPDPTTEPCNTECELRWHIARKSECTAQCGLGYRTLDIYCSKYSRLEGKIEKVDDRFCNSQAKPSTREKCTGDCNVGGWRYSAWTECSKSCGGGTRRRRAMCVNTYNDVLDDSKCSQQEKLTVQRCSDFSCPQWKTGDWSECLVTCGKGHKHRQTWCQFGEDRLNDRFCDPETKPESVQMCQQQECASWQVGPWGQCTVTCGQGYQMRAVKCVVGTYVSVVDDNDCNAATRPTDTQDCEIAVCPPHPNSPEAKRAISGIHRTQWRFGSWTPCSATCGKGTRMRYVSCRDDQGSVADESACFHLPKPSATEMCTVTPCGQWKALEWSSCSVTCGQGKATRQVICINYSDQLVDRNECDPDDLPATEQDCSMSPCHPNSHDYGRPIHPFLYPNHHLKLHPGGSPNQNRAHIPGGNQWRIGPWGAVSAPILLFLGFVGFCFFPRLIQSFLEVRSQHTVKRERDVSPHCLLSAHTSKCCRRAQASLISLSYLVSPRYSRQKADSIIFHEAKAGLCFLAVSWDIYNRVVAKAQRSLDASYSHCKQYAMLYRGSL